MSQNQGTEHELQAARELKSAQTLLTVAFIGAPVSLIFGGVPLALVALISAAIAYRKTKHVASTMDGDFASAAKSMRTQAKVALGISAFALAVALIAFVQMASMLMGAYNETGSMDAALQSIYGSGGMVVDSNVSVWDS